MAFENLSNESKVWVYQADRTFSEEEIIRLSKVLKDFVTSWDSHGIPLRAGYQIRHKQFIILAVDEKASHASGCSIDKSVALIKEIEQAFKVSLLDRSLIAFENNSSISSVKFSEIKKKVEEGVIKPDSIVFNNLISNLAELESKWQIPAKSSWMSKFFDN